MRAEKTNHKLQFMLRHQSFPRVTVCVSVCKKKLSRLIKLYIRLFEKKTA